MSRNWYYSRGSQQFGPVQLDELKGLMATGQVQMADLVWAEGMAEWTAASNVPELVGTPEIANPPQAYAAQPIPVQPNYGQPNPAEANPAWPGQTNQPYGAPPTAWQPGAPGMLGYQSAANPGYAYAPWWHRFAAAFIDGALLWVVGAIVNTVLYGIVGENYFNYIAPQTRQTMSPALAGMNALAMIIGIVMGWLYSALQESSVHQATLGKRALGIVVTDMNGQRMTFGRATGRHFAKIISGCTLLIGYIMAAFTERKQALHDLIASTLVLKKQ